MPDLERITRTIELKLAETPEEKIFIKGVHQGKDRARKEIVLFLSFLLVLALLGIIFFESE